MAGTIIPLYFEFSPLLEKQDVSLKTNNDKFLNSNKKALCYLTAGDQAEMKTK